MLRRIDVIESHEASDTIIKNSLNENIYGPKVNNLESKVNNLKINYLNKQPETLPRQNVYLRLRERNVMSNNTLPFDSLNTINVIEKLKPVKHWVDVGDKSNNIIVTRRSIDEWEIIGHSIDKAVRSVYSCVRHKLYIHSYIKVCNYLI